MYGYVCFSSWVVIVIFLNIMNCGLLVIGSRVFPLCYVFGVLCEVYLYLFNGFVGVIFIFLESFFCSCVKAFEY